MGRKSDAAMQYFGHCVVRPWFIFGVIPVISISTERYNYDDSNPDSGLCPHG
jgi:hypothetical protein